MADAIILPDLDTVNKDLEALQIKFKTLELRNNKLTKELNLMKLERDKLNICVADFKERNANYEKLIEDNMLKLQKLHAQDHDIKMKTMWFELFMETSFKETVDMEVTNSIENVDLELELNQLKEHIKEMELTSESYNKIIKNLLESIK